MSQNPKPKRNHHILPKLYLQGFVIPGDEPHLWVYKRHQKYNPGNGKLTNNPHRESIRTAGMERDYYADPKEGGGKDYETFENILESFEKPSNSILQKLCTQQRIDKNEKDVFAFYLIQMHRRVPDYRMGLKELLPKAIANYETSAELFRIIKREDTPETRAYLTAILEKIASDPQLDARTHLKVIANALNSDLWQVFRSMMWRLYVAPTTHRFFTGDNPLFFSKSLGLNKANSEISFPISSNVALVTCWDRRQGEGFITATPQIVKQINRRTAHYASNFLYASEAQEWIVRLLHKETYFFSNIK